MKVLNEKIEYLNSKHDDKKEDALPRVKNWQMALIRASFQTIGAVFPKIMAHKAYEIFATPRWRAQHTRTDAIIDAAKISDFLFQNETVKLYEWGHSEQIILLAHGWESRGTALRMYVPKLLEKGFKVVAFDAIGHGDSTGKLNNMPQNAKTIAAIIEHFGGIYGAIGHSFGCSSLIFALEDVNNDLQIEKLVFLAVPHKISKIVNGYLKMIKAPDAVKHHFYEKISQLNGRDFRNVDVAASAPPSVKVGKLLLVHDKLDKVTTIDAAENVVKNWENAQLLVTEGYGHFRLAKNPDVVRKIIAFFSS